MTFCYHNNQGCFNMVRHSTKLLIMLFALEFAFMIVPVARAQREHPRLQYGVSALTLGKEVKTAPSLTDMERDDDRALILDVFYDKGGRMKMHEISPVTARLYRDEKNFYLLFSCDEAGLSQSITPRADRIEVHLKIPEGEHYRYYRFVIHLSGASGGWLLSGDKIKLSDFEARVIAKRDYWLAKLVIPWESIGGMPDDYFGLQLARYRKMTGEVTSPSALEFRQNYDKSYTYRINENSFFMEVGFGKENIVHRHDKTLIKLPSGRQVWQKPVLLVPLSFNEKRRIFQLQQNLDTQTDKDNFAERIYLAQRWYDLLLQEGFSFVEDAGLWYPEFGPNPWTARSQINRTLAIDDTASAYDILHRLLQAFAQATQMWFADKSPGNIDVEQWQYLDFIDKPDVHGEQIELHCTAGDTTIYLYLTFPAMGGVRLRSTKPGFHNPYAIEAMTMEKHGDITRFNSLRNAIHVRTGKDWRIAILDSSGEERWSVYKGNIAFLTDEKGIHAVDIRYPLQTNEMIWGFGERFDSIDQKGNVLGLWQLNIWEASQLGGYLNHAYKIIPLMHSSAGYSLFTNSTYPIRVDLGHSEAKHIRYIIQGDILDIYLWTGTPVENLHRYVDLTGKPILPPKWAFEPWMGGGGGRWRKANAESPALAMISEAKKFAQLDIPHSAIYAEGEGINFGILYKKLLARNIRPLTYRNMRSGSNLQQYLPLVMEQEFPVVRKANGSVFYYSDVSTGLGLDMKVDRWFPYVDFTHPMAKDLIKAQLRPYFDFGVAGTMLDFGDLVHPLMVFANGAKGTEMHNFYSYDYQKCYNLVFSEMRDEDFILFGRSAAPGAQAFACTFSGDVSCNFYGLRAAMRGGLNLSSCGFSVWGSDIGGYFGQPEEEVYIRWVQFGTFSPLMRFHGTTPREPWYYSDRAVDIYKRYAWIRENLLDYTYSTAIDATISGLPLMRPLSLIYTEQKNLLKLDSQFMYGPDLMVAPVVSTSGILEVVLPEGEWTHLWSGETYKGARVVPLKVGIHDIPVFLREGAFVPAHLSDSFIWGDSMSESKVGVFIITSSHQKIAAKRWTTRSSSLDYTFEPTENGFLLNISGINDNRYLIIYGLEKDFSKIFINGIAIKRFSQKKDIKMSAGWFELQSNRTIIKLPYGKDCVVRILLSATD